MIPHPQFDFCGPVVFLIIKEAGRTACPLPLYFSIIPTRVIYPAQSKRGAAAKSGFGFSGCIRAS
jgi:hypothetical protein